MSHYGNNLMNDLENTVAMMNAANPNLDPARAARLMALAKARPVNVVPAGLPLVAPARGANRPWLGSTPRKPWEYRVTAAIPVIDFPDLLEVVIELLRLQTERPYIIVIDTGSTAANMARIESMRAEDVEVHRVHAHAWRHPSEPVATAMDLATMLCQTPYLFATHADCFLMRRDVLAEMIPLADRYKAVGYQITERHDRAWQYALGHTCAMFEMATADRISLQWSMRRYYAETGQDWSANPVTGGWPDTESLFNLQLSRAGIRPYLFGTERNYQRNTDGTIDHCRSIPGTALYARSQLSQMQPHLNEAVRAAKSRIAEWKASQSPKPCCKPSGPGTEMKKLLKELDVPDAWCEGCSQRAATMDRNGPEWCRVNRAMIVGWLQEAERHFATAAARVERNDGEEPTEQQIRKARDAQRWRTGWAAATKFIWLNPTDPFGSLVDSAIQRAEAAKNGDSAGCGT